jgi:hypothetical protein
LEAAAAVLAEAIAAPPTAATATPAAAAPAPIVVDGITTNMVAYIIGDVFMLSA